MSTTLKTQFHRQRISNNFNVLRLFPKVTVVLMQLNRFRENAFSFNLTCFNVFVMSLFTFYLYLRFYHL